MQVRFDLDALIELEETYGSIDAVQMAMGTKFFKTLRHVLWVAGTWTGDPAGAPTSEKALGALVNLKRMKDYHDAVDRALRDALGLDEGEGEAGDPPVAATAAIHSLS